MRVSQLPEHFLQLFGRDARFLLVEKRIIDAAIFHAPITDTAARSFHELFEICLAQGEIRLLFRLFPD